MPAEKQGVLVLAHCDMALQLWTGAALPPSHCRAIALSASVPEYVLQQWDCSV